MITLAKNKPILYTVRMSSKLVLCCEVISAKLSNALFLQDLELKSLLLEAYVKGQQELLYVVPFVAKVLESSLRSMVSHTETAPH